MKRVLSHCGPQTLDAGLRTPDARLPRHGGNVHAFARERSLPLQEVLDFSASINPLGWPRGARAAYKHALSLTVHYPEPYAETLTTSLAQYHGLAPGHFVVGNGSTQLIYLLARALKSRHTLLVSPTFSEHALAFRRAGTQVSQFILRPPLFALTIKELLSALAKGVDTLIVTNPNSPTGALVPKETMQETVQACRRLGVRLVVDETFVDWSEEESLKMLAQRQRHLFILRSLTKFFATPGLRIGYVIAHQKNIQLLRSQLEPWSVNTVAQAVAGACVENLPFVQQSRTFMRRERQWVEQQLLAMTGIEIFPTAANFFLVRIAKPKLTAADVAQRLAASNILIRDCRNFAGLGKQFFRVAIRRRAENKRLLAALRDALDA
jgi:threonine-phosphate decarboxylase